MAHWQKSRRALAVAGLAAALAAASLAGAAAQEEDHAARLQAVFTEAMAEPQDCEKLARALELFEPEAPEHAELRDALAACPGHAPAPEEGEDPFALGDGATARFAGAAGSQRSGGDPFAISGLGRGASAQDPFAIANSGALLLAASLDLERMRLEREAREAAEAARRRLEAQQAEFRAAQARAEAEAEREARREANALLLGGFLTGIARAAVNTRSFTVPPTPYAGGGYAAGATATDQRRLQCQQQVGAQLQSLQPNLSPEAGVCETSRASVRLYQTALAILTPCQQYYAQEMQEYRRALLQSQQAEQASCTAAR